MIQDTTRGIDNLKGETQRAAAVCSAHGDGSRVASLVLAGVHSWGGDVLEMVTCKLLLPVALRPLISYGVDWLRKGLVGDPCICANSETPVLRRCLGGGSLPEKQLTYYEDRMPRGPAGCVRDAAEGLGGGTIVVVEGTIVPSFDLNALVGAHFRHHADLTVVVEEAPIEGRRGIKPAGVYVFSRSALEHVSRAGYQDIKEVLIPKLYAAGRRVVTHEVPAGSALRVSCADSYLDVNMTAVSRLAKGGQPPKGFVRAGDLLVHESARIEPGARLKGAALIGPDCRVASSAMIIGPVVLGRGCEIERDVVLSRSVLWDACSIGRGAIVDRSILTNGTSVASGLVSRQAIFVGARSERAR